MQKTFTFLALTILLPLLLSAQWNSNPSTHGTAVCTAPTSEYPTISVTDGSNGSIVVFGSSNANTTSIHAQRITSDGSIAWANVNTPVKISIDASINLSDAVSDGAGGAFITWIDHNSNHGSRTQVYLQHINSSGNALWSVNGFKGKYRYLN